MSKALEIQGWGNGGRGGGVGGEGTASLLGC